MTAIATRVAIGIAATIAVVAIATGPTGPELDTPATSPDVMAYTERGK